MATVSVTNTTSQVSSAALMLLAADQTVTGLKTFNRAPSAPFAVQAGSAVVTNLDADKLDGYEATQFAVLAENETVSGTWTFNNATAFPAGTVAAPAISVRSSDNGMYSSGTDAVDFATNGTKALGIDSTQFIDSPTQPRCVAYYTSTYSINSTNETVLPLDTDEVDVGGLHDPSVNNTRITIPVGGDGFYLISGHATFAPNATGRRIAYLKKNGIGGYLRAVDLTPSATVQTVVEISTMVNLVAGDYIEISAYQDSGGALNTGSAARYFSNDLSVVKLW